MTLLRIEHPITSYAVWKQAFDRFAEARHSAGVRGYRIRRPSDDPLYLVIDLDFDTEAQASGFLQLLRTRVWSNAENSPALAGEPVTSVLETVDESG